MPLGGDEDVLEKVDDSDREARSRRIDSKQILTEDCLDAPKIG